MSEANGRAQRFVSPDAATPRPWKVTRGSLIRVTGPDACVIAGVHKQGFYVGEGRQGSTTIALANAELIVEAVNSHASLLKALEEAKAKFEEVATWLERLAANSEEQAQTSARFPSLEAACKADAKNYRATAKNIREEIARIDAVIQKDQK